MNRWPVLSASLAFVLSAGCELKGTDGYERPAFTPSSSGSADYIPPAADPVARSFTILHTNDEHSHLLGFGPNSDYPFVPVPGDTDGSLTIANAAAKIAAGAETVGGFARRDYLLTKLRSASEHPVITISAGDSTAGTLFGLAGTLAAPDWVAMTLAGYDYMTLGNHEFDLGPDVLGLTIQTASNITFGGMPKIIASNIHFDDVVSPNSGTLLMSQWGDGGSGALIQPWDVKLLANGLKVGLLGALGYTPALEAPAKAPISFSVPKTGAACTGDTCEAGESCVQGYCVNPLDSAGHVAAAAAELQEYVDTLRNRAQVDVVVLISHMGMTEDQAIASLTTGIDVIIGGHSHDAMAATLVGDTIIAQAGYHGDRLGETTITVETDGSISLASGLLHDVDSDLDAEIFAGTSLPTEVSTAFERAVSLTLGVIAPTADGLNQLFAPSISTGILGTEGLVTDLWSSTFAIGGTAVFESDHDITRGAPFTDSPLAHLVTDAEYGSSAAAGCFVDLDGAGSSYVATSNAAFMVAVQANGVLRDDLEFGIDGSASFADVFRVLPLGASPFQQTVPGYPLVAFQLGIVELVAGLDIGFTRGLEQDSFFLSYSGIEAEYDPDGPAFDATTFDPASSEPQSRLTKLSKGTDTGNYTTIFEYDAADTKPWAARWSETDLATDKVLVITNLYIAGFMQAFGFTPLDPYTGEAITPSENSNVPTSLAVLSKTILCHVAESANCATPTPSIAPCVSATGGDVPDDLAWPDGLNEVKDWAVLFGYMQSALGGTIPDCDYQADETNCGPFPSRVAVTSN